MKAARSIGELATAGSVVLLFPRVFSLHLSQREVSVVWNGGELARKSS
jgi:hypothetical protein